MTGPPYASVQNPSCIGYWLQNKLPRAKASSSVAQISPVATALTCGMRLQQAGLQFEIVDKGAAILRAVLRLEKTIFAKSEAWGELFHQELAKRNTHLLVCTLKPAAALADPFLAEPQGCSIPVPAAHLHQPALQGASKARRGKAAGKAQSGQPARLQKGLPAQHEPTPDLDGDGVAAQLLG